MVQLGYALSSEEHMPNDLVRNAKRAEEVGFQFALISDHFHPWVNKQGQSPMVWAVLGAIASQTQRLRIGTGVTCPMIRTHPAIIAQAAATIGAMMPGRFFLGVGTGENLNEHIFGDKWPAYDIREEMLEEAVEVIRLLWEGGEKSFYGAYYTLENARIYTLPDPLPEIMVAAAGTKSAQMAGEIGDGLICTSPDQKVVQTFEQAGGQGKPKIGQYGVCIAENEQQGRKIAYEWWPNAAIKGELSQELPTPAHFEQAAKMVTEDQVAESILCSTDPQQHFAKIQQYMDTGFDYIYVHQIGPNQDIFFDFYQKHILPEFAQMAR